MVGPGEGLVMIHSLTKAQVAPRVALMVGLLGASANCFAAATDFDGDGKSDVVVIASGSGQQSWQALYSSTGQAAALGSIGSTGDYPIMADWLASGKPQIGTASFDEERSSVVWSIKDAQGQTLQREFGTSGDLLISGADFNNNGYADAAAARIVRKKVKWTVALDLFSPAGKSQREVFFGQSGDRLFYINPDGSGDWLGAVRKGKRRTSIVQIKNLSTGEVRTISGIGSFASAAPRPRPVAVKRGDNSEYLVFAVKGRENTKLYRQELSSASAAKFVLPGTAEPVVGDFMDAPGEEVGIANDAGFIAWNPDSNQMVSFNIPAGTPLDEINLNTAGASSAPVDQGGAAAPDGCLPAMVISSLNGVLYKSSEGSRGPALIIRSSTEKPGPHSLEIRDANCSLIGRLGFYADSRSGAVYYSKISGGSYASASSLQAAALRTGEPYLFIQGRGKWIVVVNPTAATEGSSK